MNRGWVLLLILSTSLSAGDLPTSVDNSQSDYFPPVVRQTYESCAQQVGIYAMTTFALNRARGTSAQRLENQLAPRFSWNFLNHGKNRGAELVEGWQLAQAMGSPSLADASLGHTEWLHGYPVYLKAMQNRVRSFDFFQLTSVADLQRAKTHLHKASQPRQRGGLLAIEGRLPGATMVTIPKGQHEAGKTLVVNWGRRHGPGHLMTYVGYDDAVGHDVNGDGSLSNDQDITGDGKITLADWERGAFLAVNSFGTEWGDQGKCYVLYRESAVTTFRRGQWAASVDAWPNYHPQLTLKLTFATSNRSGIHISVMAEGAAKPHTPLIFAHGKAALTRPKKIPESPEKYSGYLLGQARLGTQPARLIDGESAPIEMGFDLTGRVPIQTKTYQLLLERAVPSAQALVVKASICRYLPTGQMLDELSFIDLPTIVGSRPITVQTAK